MSTHYCHVRLDACRSEPWSYTSTTLPLAALPSQRVPYLSCYPFTCLLGRTGLVAVVADEHAFRPHTGRAPG